MTPVAFVVLAIGGTLARVVVSAALNRPDFPAGTLMVNIVGSFLLGLVAGAGAETVTAVGLAGLGALTTFSTLTNETIAFGAEGRVRLAAAYLGVTVVAGVAAAWLGLTLG